jgi:hypothetical protein
MDQSDTYEQVDKLMMHFTLVIIIKNSVFSFFCAVVSPSVSLKLILSASYNEIGMQLC